MSGLQVFSAFVLGGLTGVVVTYWVVKAFTDLNPLGEADVRRLWSEACQDVGSVTIESFARRIENHLTK
jgi:hypothetical protein